MAELRREPVLERWVVVTAQPWEALAEVLRQRRERNGRSSCPFCPGQERETPEEVYAVRDPASRPDDKGWSLRVVPNKFPALRIEGEIERSGEGVFDRISATGAHEIVIETASHADDWDRWSLEAVAEVLKAYRERSLDLRRDERFRQVLVARNHGPGLALLPHPHSHVLALPVVPKRIDDEVRGVLEYFGRKERCAYCDIVHQELADGERVICETGAYVAIAAFAARYPFETWVLPKDHDHDFGAVGAERLVELAGLLKALTGTLHRLLPDLAYSLVLHTSPLQRFVEPRYHWHLEIRVRLAVGEGFEWGTGFFVNPVAPEEAARLLRSEA
jgi:UDPglucose--hexose-1-phosphate uridylyltransferase